MSEITVRPAQPGDGEGIAPLSHDSAAYYGELAVPFWRGRGYRTRNVIMHKRLD